MLENIFGCYSSCPVYYALHCKCLSLCICLYICVCMSSWKKMWSHKSFSYSV